MPFDPSRQPPRRLGKWLRATDVDFGDMHGMLVGQFAVAAQAAIAGQGVVLLPMFLIETELARRDLMVAVGKPMESAEAY